MSVLARLAIWMLALGLVLLPVVAVLNGWLAADRWPIEQLRIHAEYRRVDAEQIRAAVAPAAGQGFFAVDLDQVRRAVLGLDWVAAAEVRKVWPNRLEITVEEHQPFARWGEDRLLSARGLLFPLPADAASLALPEFQGGEQHAAELMRVHGLAAPLFALHGSELVGLRLSARGSWSFRLAEGAVVMAGRGDPMARLERFVPLFAELRAVEQRPLERADLRYANGFALRWAETAGATPMNPESRIPNPQA
ncbi:cell division protein FtsQ/DivIB [Pseudomarimonas salicorniae]|uniref:Cell division protein FtsQ n=1 Tax=Pseudomarimonas salicorniae TaxID=2933270 RepID=A0ABT0GHE9_9GAMM|nr:FtsQ-type POTRA domain-containing protein [Lysobacter sp. CAU 1642]MCK7593956.1 FtsQ-type POTRA domain-containing protein [Lysobacter sp. CAU 1642]